MERPRGENLWRSSVICHVQHTRGDEGELKRCMFITKTWGGYEDRLNGNSGHAERTMENWDKEAEDTGTGGSRMCVRGSRVGVGGLATRKQADQYRHSRQSDLYL